MVIKNANAFIDGRFKTVDIELSGGKIHRIGNLRDAGTYDARGQYVLPGFVDIHIHAFGGADCMRGEADVRQMSLGLRRTGVAAFVPTTMSAYPEETRAALRGISRVMHDPEPLGSRVLGAHMEAPFLAPDYKGAQRAECLMLPSVSAYLELTEGADCVRMMTLAPELPGALPLIAYLKDQEIVTCAAHTGATAAQIHAAADAGLSQITHLFNAQTPLHHREPGVPGAGLADDRIAVQLIADCIHLHPDVLRIAGLCKGAKGCILISDSMEAAGLPDGRYSLGGQEVIVSEGAARLVSGVLAGSTLMLHQAVHNMIVQCGLAPETVIPMATSTPAAAIQAEGFGKIAEGYAGTLVVMDKDWNFVTALYEGMEM